MRQRELGLSPGFAVGLLDAVPLDRLFSVPEPLFPHLKKGDNNTYSHRGVFF